MILSFYTQLELRRWYGIICLYVYIGQHIVLGACCYVAILRLLMAGLCRLHLIKLKSSHCSSI